MSDVHYVEPETLQGVYEALERYGEDARLLAGGTALMNLMKQRLVQPECLVGLRRVTELTGIRQENGALHIGALVSHRDLEISPLVLEWAPLLIETYRQVATVRIRNVATVGGGLAHADPNQDPPASLIVLDARVHLASRQGVRALSLEEFFTDYYETALLPGEVVTHVAVPSLPPRGGSAYLKFLPRTADDYATVSVAALVALEEDGATCREARIALGSLGSTVVRGKQAEEALRGQRLTPEALRAAAAAVRPAVDPISDYRGSADYKRDMAEVFTRRALEAALAQAKRGAA